MVTAGHIPDDVGAALGVPVVSVDTGRGRGTAADVAQFGAHQYDAVNDRMYRSPQIRRVLGADAGELGWAILVVGQQARRARHRARMVDLEALLAGQLRGLEEGVPVHARRLVGARRAGTRDRIGTLRR